MYGVWMGEPCRWMTHATYATTSGLNRPYPAGSSAVDMPRDENGAILLR